MTERRLGPSRAVERPTLYLPGPRRPRPGGARRGPHPVPKRGPTCALRVRSRRVDAHRVVMTREGGVGCLRIRGGCRWINAMSRDCLVGGQALVQVLVVSNLSMEIPGRRFRNELRNAVKVVDAACVVYEYGLRDDTRSSITDYKWPDWLAGRNCSEWPWFPQTCGSDRKRRQRGAQNYIPVPMPHLAHLPASHKIDPKTPDKRRV